MPAAGKGQPDKDAVVAAAAGTEQIDVGPATTWHGLRCVDWAAIQQ